MSSFDIHSDPLLSLVVKTADRATEIFVLDGSSKLVAYGLGELEAQLPLGIYKIRASAGGQEVERLVLLEPPKSGQKPPEPTKPGSTLRVIPNGVEVTFDPIRFSSPAPLDDTFAPKVVRDEVELQSDTVRVTIGAGSSVFVCARDQSVPGSPAPFPSLNPATGLTLRDGNDEVLVDFEQESVFIPGSNNPWAACNVELNPGIYRLSVQTPGDRYTQTVVASPGRQIQIFLLLRSYRQGKSGRRADLAGAAIILRVPGSPLSSTDLRLMELARMGFRDRRVVVRREDIDEMILGKFVNPMLGVLATYLLLSANPSDQGLRQGLRVILANMRRLLGKHPDVEAMALEIEGTEGPLPLCPDPPMLLESWLSIRKAAFERPEIIPDESPLARLAKRFWGPGPVLVWREPAAGGPAPAALGADRLAAITPSAAAAPLTVEQWVRRLRKMNLEAAKRRTDLDDFDLVALREITSAHPDPIKDRLVRALDLPEPAVIQVLKELYAKLSHTR